MTADLASIIDRCLDDIVTGRCTVSECLDRHPEHRAELEPLLAAATTMHAQPRIAEAAPDRIRRAAFMELIRETPQQSRRWWLPRGIAAGMLSGALFPRLAAAAAPVALAAVLGTFLLVSQPASPAAASTLTLFAGAAEVQVNGEWKPLTDGASLAAGARLRTTPEGRALLTFPDGSTSALDPSTEISIEQLSAGVPRNVQLRQFSGRLWNDVVTDERFGAKYEVHTTDAVVQVHGTVFEIAVDGGQTSVVTAEGAVEVILADERVSVARGETVRAQAQQLADRGTVERGGSLTIDAPFTAALLSDRGEATGARRDGVIFRQIRGVTTSNPGDGPQRFDFQQLDSGTYTLSLQRFGQGSGDLVLDVGGAEHRVPIDATTGASEVRVVVERQNGSARVSIADQVRPAAASAVSATAVRVVETERTKKAADVVTQRTAAAAAASAAAATPAVTPASGSNAAPTTTPTVPPIEAFSARLRDAAQRNDIDAIRSVLREITGGTDNANTQARLRVLVAVLATEDGRLVARVAAEDSTIRARLLDRGAGLPNAEQERLRRALANNVGTPTPIRTTPTPTRTPNPTASPTPTSTPRVTATTPPPATPTRTPNPTATTPPPVVDTFGPRLRTALSSGSGLAIRDVLDDILDANVTVRRARMTTLAGILGDRTDAARIHGALDGDGGLRSRLLRAVEADAPAAVRGALIAGLSDNRPTPTPSPTPSPTATTPTPTSNPTPTPSGTPTATPSPTATTAPVVTSTPAPTPTVTTAPIETATPAPAASPTPTEVPTN